jgi:hypothetical protein
VRKRRAIIPSDDDNDGNQLSRYESITNRQLFLFLLPCLGFLEYPLPFFLLSAAGEDPTEDDNVQGRAVLSVTVDPSSIAAGATLEQTLPSAGVSAPASVLVIAPAPKALKPKKLVPKKSKLYVPKVLH